MAIAKEMQNRCERVQNRARIAEAWRGVSYSFECTNFLVAYVPRESGYSLSWSNCMHHPVNCKYREFYFTLYSMLLKTHGVCCTFLYPLVYLCLFVHLSVSLLTCVHAYRYVCRQMCWSVAFLIATFIKHRDQKFPTYIIWSWRVLRKNLSLPSFTLLIRTHL